MRLLTHNTGRPNLTRDLPPGKIPPYAILSHTWGSDGEEVTYQDMVDGTGEAKAGYAKIRFCAEKAKQDGLQHFWIDTCCIDKSNSSELSEAIISMFRWYQQADRCYVYLTDVSVTDPSAPTTDPQQSLSHDMQKLAISRTPSSIQPPEQWDAAFRSSRWFTRGWTLQELLAPASVDFFSNEGYRLGDKKTLEHQVHEITGIPIPAIQGVALHKFGIEERFNWSAGRQTTRDEDLAYCLLGVFGVSMSPLYGEGKSEALRRLRKEIDDSLRRDGSLTDHVKGSGTRLWMVPFDRNPSFSGRELELGKIRQAIFTGHNTAKVAITGLGGVGKTQLVLELLYRVKAEAGDCSVIWIPATSTESIAQAYLHAAQKLDLPGWEDGKADVMKLVQDHLSSARAGRWLLVFDNADDVDMWVGRSGSSRLIDYLPQSNQGSIIFTTRDRKVAVKLARQHVIEVPDMDEAGALQLLQNYLVDQELDNQGDASALLVWLTYLPLAVVQAAMYINENMISIQEYLSLLNEQEEGVIDLLSEDFEDEWRYRDIKNPVATTWLISFRQIQQRDALAADYLSFIACVDPKGIPQSLFLPGPSRKKEIDAIGTLRSYSFISRQSTGSAIDVHRLVHLATRNWLRREGLLREWTRKAVRRLDGLLADAGRHNRVEWMPYLPHAYYALASSPSGDDGDGDGDDEDEDRLYLLHVYGACLKHDGQYQKAETQLRRAVKVMKKVLGEEHQSTLCCMNDLASVCWNAGKWDEAESLGVQVVEMAKARGEEHPDRLAGMNNLATTYWSQGRWNEAAALSEQAIEISKRVLGEEHPNTLTHMANLAKMYLSQGKSDKAESLCVEVLGMRQRVLGEEHTDTVLSKSNLVSIYTNQKRWDKAEALGVQVVEMKKKLLGEEHPNTLLSIANLASIYFNQDRLDEAETLDFGLAETGKRTLGEEHDITLDGLSHLSLVYAMRDRWDESESLARQVLDIRKRVLGEEHPTTLSSMSRLAHIWWSQRGRDAEAIELLEDCLRLRQKVLGPDHPNTRFTAESVKRWAAG